ncbi:MAG TPA: tetratricopeptide repeat protein [Pyrinomonadaceae bacterium]|nr:tetratricopeptide repeat protein [Pyrinomonadaceae bacterium]
MIFCSGCGSPLSDSLSFCPECGVETPYATRAETLPLVAQGANQSGAAAVAAARAPIVANAAASSLPFYDYGLAQTPAQPAQQVKSSGSKTLLIALSATAILAIALAIYFGARAVGSRNPQASALESSLERAVDGNRLIALSDDDAYSYYFKLKGIDPQNSFLSEIKPKVLPQIQSMGDEILRKRVEQSLEILTERDWTVAAHAFQWAHEFEPGNKAFEARWKYAEGNVAKAQNRRDDAERSFNEAIQLDSSWAVPVNDLGFLRSLNKRYAEAIPFYQTAIRLQPNWDIPYNNMGTAYFLQKNYDEAEGWYRKALGISPNWATPHAWLGSIYQSKHMNSEAIAEYQTAINLNNPNRDKLDVPRLQSAINSLQGSGEEE